MPTPPAVERVGRAALVVPAVASGTALAVLVIGSRVHLGLVVVVMAGATLFVTAARTQLAFRQALRLADARRQALTDDLTGLANSRALCDHLRRRLDSHRPIQTAVLLVDLDHFREINETLGHQAGDQVLRLVDPRLAPLIGPGNLLVRTGGDEFAIAFTASVDDSTASGYGWAPVSASRCARVMLTTPAGFCSAPTWRCTRGRRRPPRAVQLSADQVRRFAVKGHRAVALRCAGPAASRVTSMDFKLELVPVPVSDVDRARAF